MPRARNPQPQLEVSTDAARRGRDRARAARAVGIREIRDLMEGLHPVRDAPRLVAGITALDRLEEAERKDTDDER